MDKWEPGAHGGTFGGNPLACAAGSAVLDIMDTDFLEHVKTVGAYFTAKLQKLQEKYPVISSVRGLGLMIAIEFRKNGGKPATELVAKVREEALQKHLILLNCGVFHNVIRFIPPLIIEKSDVDKAIEILDTNISLSLKEVGEN